MGSELDRASQRVCCTQQAATAQQESRVTGNTRSTHSGRGICIKFGPASQKLMLKGEHECWSRSFLTASAANEGQWEMPGMAPVQSFGG